MTLFQKNKKHFFKIGLKKILLRAELKKAIESIYTSGIDDVMEDPQPKSGSISSGYFLDDGQRFRYEISNNGTISYNPD